MERSVNGYRYQIVSAYSVIIVLASTIYWSKRTETYGQKMVYF